MWPGCQKQFYHSQAQETAEQQLYEQHRDHMFKKHGPFNI